MTFYWWSHWFWITLLSNVLFPLIAVVHTYPSQESLKDYNHNQEDIPKKLITKLYQSTTVLSWATEQAPIFTRSTTIKENSEQKHKEQIHEVIDSKSPVPLTNNNEEEEYYYEEDTTDDVNQRINLEQMETELERKENNIISFHKDLSENDVKRSAEVINKDTLETKTVIKSSEKSTPLPQLIEENNYTNFTDKTVAISTNTFASILNNYDNNTVTKTTTTNSTSTSTSTSDMSSNANTQTTNATTDMPLSIEKDLANGTAIILPQAPETPKIVKTQAVNLDWLNTVAAHLPPAHVTTDNGAHDYSEEQHKIPFTLENVNKPEDLRREEGEHRTRKSKGLSAEYKVNRYINYSSDSKNLLTRSAATTVNELESEESNISSEALSVQRAYFMDIGAISAICFTVFGICCTIGTVGIVLYRRRYLNKPQALSEPDSSVYIDDSTMRVSDNSDEMYSLDNDSFLNSLEAMTIQNYWTDTVKHTKL